MPNILIENVDTETAESKICFLHALTSAVYDHCIHCHILVHYCWLKNRLREMVDERNKRRRHVDNKKDMKVDNINLIIENTLLDNHRYWVGVQIQSIKEQDFKFSSGDSCIFPYDNIIESHMKHEHKDFSDRSVSRNDLFNNLWLVAEKRKSEISIQLNEKNNLTKYFLFTYDDSVQFGSVDEKCKLCPIEKVVAHQVLIKHKDLGSIDLTLD